MCFNIRHFLPLRPSRWFRPVLPVVPTQSERTIPGYGRLGGFFNSRPAPLTGRTYTPNCGKRDKTYPVPVMVPRPTVGLAGRISRNAVPLRRF